MSLRISLCRLCVPVVLGLAAYGGVAPATAAELPEGTSFFDDFDRLDTALWGVSDGWVNGNWQNCEWRRDVVSVSDGLLRLGFRAAPTEKRPYRCGEIQSRHSYGYGTYEARFRTASGSGLNAAFFTYIGPHHGQPHDEIDVEVLTRDTGRVSFNTYVSGKPLNGGSVDLSRASDTGFVSYAFTWTPEGITWHVDGRKRHETDAGSALPATRQKIYASFWGSDSFPNWMGPFVEPPGDLTMDIDWIAFTELGAACQFPMSVLCTAE